MKRDRGQSGLITFMYEREPFCVFPPQAIFEKFWPGVITIPVNAFWKFIENIVESWRESTRVTIIDVHITSPRYSIANCSQNYNGIWIFEICYILVAYKLFPFPYTGYFWLQLLRWENYLFLYRARELERERSVIYCFRRFHSFLLPAGWATIYFFHISRIIPRLADSQKMKFEYFLHTTSLAYARPLMLNN